MVEKKFPYIRVTSVSTNGNYYGAYENSDEDAKKGYTIFITNSANAKTYCECMGYVHGKMCYHIKESLEKEKMIFGNEPVISQPQDNSKKERGEEREDGK